ncbi:MAG TPA: Gmad2 immunoglobulin-like domain-containing protein [Nocardioidaceae bacterium]|nr:Gmad2 immunoglobulin-like domain-containing protein [Nocardioidaceae bacterium]
MVKRYEDSDHAAFENLVRESLRREADTVEPAEGLRAIQTRTARAATGGARRRWVATGAVLATAAAVIAIALTGAIGLGDGDDTAAPAGPAGSGATRAVQVFYLDSTPERLGEPGSVSVDDPGLYRETHLVEADGDRVEAAVRELLSSPPDDGDYRNPWAGITLNSVEVGPGARRVVVDVSAVPDPSAVGGPADQALAHTVSAATGGTPLVVVELDGRPDGRDLRAGDPVGTFARIWVSTPEQGDSVTSPVRFTGLAATFEGNVAYELRRGSQVVARGATTSESGLGWSEWSFTQRLRPGDYTLVAFDEDPALGGRRDIDTKDFTVR